MDDKGRESTDTTQAGLLCPVCGHPVGTTVRRYKTLGTFVPRWTPAPCANPDCATRQGTAEEPGPQATRRNTARRPRGAHRADPAR